jgi:excinuclease ABC subunit C
MKKIKYTYQNSLQGQYLKKIKLPDAPGVYLFKNGANILYIGKATSLKDRVRSYFGADLIQTRGPLLVDMLYQANKIDFIKTNSVLEAIILEANLIKKHQPKYNTKEKDNKSFNYVVITKEDFPRILIVRGRELEKGVGYKIMEKFGPFTSGESLRTILKIIRKIFPFRDRCLPGQGKPCFNRQLGLCPGVCDGGIGKRDYAKIVNKIKLLLSGRINSLKTSLKKEMRLLSKKQEYEKANEVKKQIFSLDHIQDVALIKEDRIIQEKVQPQVLGYFCATQKPDHLADQFPGQSFRIEAYDISHISGTNNVGVMVVMEGGEFKKSDYRKFKINNSKGNDIGALQEILERRLKHLEWSRPNLIVVDGGLAHLNVAKRTTAPNPSLIKEGERKNIIVVSVIKDSHHKAKAIIGDENIINIYKKEILQLNNEAHRFAIAYHRQKRQKMVVW